MLPKMSGIEICKKIRQNPKTNNIKIAFLTVMGFKESDNIELEELNILDYITKPFDNDDLVKRVNKLIEK